MSYTVVFKTLFIKSTTGEVLQLERIGCNNDDEGRTDYDYTATFYANEADLLNYINTHYENAGDDLCVICGKRKTVKDYFKHLLTRYKKALSFDDMKKQYFNSFNTLKSITFYKPEKITVKVCDFEKYYKQFKNQFVSYKRDFMKIEGEKSVFQAAKANQLHLIYLKKRKYPL